MRPRVRDGSLAYAYSRDDKHRDPMADSQLANRDRLVKEGHLYIKSNLSDPDPGRYRGVDDHHNTVVVVPDGVGRPHELNRPVRSSHLYPGADDRPLSCVYHHGMARLDG